MTRNFAQICRFNNDVYLGTDTQTLQQRLEALEYQVAYLYWPDTISNIFKISVIITSTQFAQRTKVQISASNNYLGPNITWTVSTTNIIISSPSIQTGTLKNGESFDYSYTFHGAPPTDSPIATLKFNKGEVSYGIDIDRDNISSSAYYLTLNCNKSTGELSITTE